jgi:hypothetical protein
VYIVVLRFANDLPQSPEQCAQLARVYQDSSMADDTLRHVYVGATEQGPAAVFFLVAASLAQAERAARSIHEDAKAAGAPVFELLSVTADFVSPLAERALWPEG